MPKQEYKILEFHGGTNNKFDPRDIAENQNTQASFSVRRPGRLTTEGGFKSTYHHSSVNGKAINDIDGTLAFKAGYGLYMFSHDYDMDATPDEVDSFFIVTNDSVDIDIYDSNKSGGAGWNDAKFKLGSRVATVKPDYFNVDGGLRASDSNFGVTSTGLLTNANPTSKATNVITTDSGTIATGSLIQINQEIMYVTTGSSSGTTITVIRGFANTKVTTHADNSTIYYINAPKYFGHIKQDRLFECETSNSINTWVEDIQTPQPPNNTRKSDGTSGTLASSKGIQSLRVYDITEISTANYPAESEKVIIEFEEGQADVGIKKVENVNSTHVMFTTSGRGNDASGSNGLAGGEEITLTNMQGVAAVINNTYPLVDATSSTFTVEVDPSIADVTLDYDVSGRQTAIADWYDHSESGEIDNALGVNVAATELPSSGGMYPIHITGETGVNGFNGIYEARVIDDNDLYIINNLHGSHADGTTNGQVQQLIGIARPSESGAINPDLKRKWNFAMSFTYDGPGQEVQESLLTMGYTVYASKRNDGTTNTLNEALDDSETGVDVDYGAAFTVNESVIMVDSEQMLVTGIATNTLTVTRGYNGTDKDTHDEDAQIYVVEELSPTATVDWTNFIGVPSCVVKTVYNHGVDEKTWNARINGFKIYMKDVTEEDSSKEWRLFSHFNFNKGTYSLFAAGDSELILEQPGTWTSDGQICTISTGTDLTMKPIDTYLSENLFTEDTFISAQYKTSCVAGRKVYIGNIKQGGRTYPDRMIRTPINKFDTFPETNYIDVAVGDGDAITKLISYGDRLLQFKKSKLYLINIAGASEVLEAEFENAGVEFPSQVCKTNSGVAWINSAGLWIFDGKQVNNVTRYVENDGYTLTNSTPDIATIGFDQKNNRLIYATDIENGSDTKLYIYDLELKAYQSYHKGLLPFSGSSANYYTNMINDMDGKLLIGYVDSSSANKGELNIYEWSNSSMGDVFHFGDYFISKDIDFGSPSVRKKIYKVYITYKCTGHSGVKVQYATNGSTTFNDFSSSKSTNYSIGALENSSGEWAVAELKPSSSINNIKSIQLKFTNEDGLSIHSSGTCNDTTGADSTHMRLNTSSAGGTADVYNNYNIGITGGTARYNVRLISDYNGTTKEATLSSAMTDYGYGNVIDTTTTYKIGVVPADFEINDISIIFRPKRVK